MITLKAFPARFNSVRMAKAQGRLERLPVTLMKIGSMLLKEVQRNLSGRVLHKRTGNLYNCMNFQLALQEQGWKIIVGSTGDVPYDWIHEKGGFAGRNRSIYLRRRSYLEKAYIDKREQVDRWLHKFLQEVFKP